MAEPMSILSNPYFYVIIIGIAIIGLYKWRKGKTENIKDYIDFKPQPIEKTFQDELKEKVDIKGIKMKRGRLMFGSHIAGRIDKYAFIKGYLPVVVYDTKTKMTEIKVDKEGKEAKQKFNFIIIRCLSNNFLMRLFGMNKRYFIFEDKIIKLDVKGRRIFLPFDIDVASWGDIWTNSELAAEYLNDNISAKRMLLQTLSHTENMPDRLIVLEAQTTRKERLAKTMSELEKGRYQNYKLADDTSIKE